MTQIEGLAAVLVNWQSPEHTLRAIRSLDSGSRQPQNIVVIDNGSSEGHRRELVEALADNSRTQVITLDKNTGYAAAVNLGASRAAATGASTLLIMNSDVELATDCLANLCNDWDPSGEIRIPVIWYGDPADPMIWWAGGRLIRPWLRVRHEDKDAREIKRQESTTPVHFVSGCMILISARIWESLDGFNERYFLYWEDVDFSLRATSLGYRLACVNSANLHHSVSASSGGLSVGSPTSNYFEARNRWLLVRERDLPRSAWIGGAFFAGVRLLWLARSTIFADAAHQACLLSAWKGTMHGLRGDFTRRAPIDG